MTLPPECFPNIHPFWWSGASLSSLVERTFVRISTHPFQAHTLFTFFYFLFFFRPILPWPSFPSRTPWAAGWVPGCPASRWASRKLLERRRKRYLKKGGIKNCPKRISFECRSECRQAGLSRTVGAAWKRCLPTRWFSSSFFFHFLLFSCSELVKEW